MWAVFGGVFLCTPVGKLWQPNVPGWCMNAEHYWLSTAAVNVILDFSVLILPMPKLIMINLPKRQKAALLFVFLLGGFGSIVSLVRLLIVHLEATEGHYVASGIAAITWSAVEANTGIICASLIALKPLFVRFFPRLMLSNEPARCCMRLPTIPGDGTEPCSHSHRTLVGTMRSGNTSQQTVVPDAACYTSSRPPAGRPARKQSAVPSEAAELESPMEYPETASRAQWRRSMALIQVGAGVPV
ncbi:MAG: hypothetical protein M1822_007356 [Bathelium mastoideum]|nr:MAG: hypothetical protein M1822_007356 [Bathelium mastoideum]